MAGLSQLVPPRTSSRAGPRQDPRITGSLPGSGANADCSGRHDGLRGGWGRTVGACPNWGDEAPRGRLPTVLGPWPPWDHQDEEQPEAGSAGAVVHLEEEAEGEAEEPPQ